ncbi:Piso0_002759 [Millerozyma farinosa CBS 7064]|uniref:Piso0_002759 protein n=1 Tax=Pichia sorbitophila (strain ATCC MYA-4447 / BCRC 22081 / CBS 7064 / NBRC 10061 / NRRL Y-12695) TaxID=559304 RepID=G8YFW4_PICSO|nr:Piso0_002759 [Millerozyma farinosa CBS 7064]
MIPTDHLNYDTNVCAFCVICSEINCFGEFTVLNGYSTRSRMATIPITKDIITSIIPSSNLSDLGSTSGRSNDIENDISYLLSWLEAIWDKKQLVEEPSARVKSAIRSCLKDEYNQLEFVKLYNNTIRSTFMRDLKPFLVSNESLIQTVTSIKELQILNSQISKCLGLKDFPREVLDRNMNTLFRSVFSDCNMNFSDKLTKLLNDNLFQSETPQNYDTIRDALILLSSIGLNEELNSITVDIAIERIKTYLFNTCLGLWDTPLLEQINSWIRKKLFPRFSMVVSLSDSDFDETYVYDLIKIAHTELVSLRIKEIFDLVSNYPQTTLALSELHQCVSFKGVNIDTHSSDNIRYNDSTCIGLSASFSNILNFSYNHLEKSSYSQAHQRAKLVDRFITLCNDKLLHSGANTVDIILCYISTIKSFLIIDPKGVLLDKVVRPIRRYLRSREDIIVKIVHGLLNESKENRLIELSDELKNNRKKSIAFDDSTDINWVPDPIDALPDFKKGKVTDIIESLISIFDSKEIFINEFTLLFGKRLLEIQGYDVSHIIYQLELLKARFGETEFNTLDVMIRDIEESKSINSSLVHGNMRFHVSVLSHIYWQTISQFESAIDDSLVIPESVQSQFREVEQRFSEIKTGRGLKLLPTLGKVKLELEVGGTVKPFQVMPMEASIIMLFQDNPSEMTVETVARSLQISEYAASKGLEFWEANHILRKMNNSTYIINE